MSKERHQAMVQPDLSVRHADQCRVSAVPIHEYEPTRFGLRNTPPDVVEDCEQRGRRQPDGPRRPSVFVRLGVCERREQPNIQLSPNPFDRGGSNTVGDEKIGIERQMGPVLFDRAEWLNENTSVGDESFDIGSAEFGQVS